MKKDYSALEKWDDDYNGACIYSLIDSNGNRYIGQAMHAKQRYNQHRQELSKAKRGIPSSNEGLKMREAVLSGAVFRFEILIKIDWQDASINILRDLEKYYLDIYGGIDNTYNTAPVTSPNWRCVHFNDVYILLDLKETDADIIEWLGQQDNMQGYIKNLIREDMRKRQN